MSDAGVDAIDQNALVTVREAAAYLACSSLTVRRKIKSGCFESVKVGGSRRIFYHSLASYIQAGKERYPLTYPVWEAAALLSVSEWVIRKRVKDGTLTGVKIGRQLRITNESIERFLR